MRKFLYNRPHIFTHLSHILSSVLSSTYSMGSHRQVFDLTYYIALTTRLKNNSMCVKSRYDWNRMAGLLANLSWLVGLGFALPPLFGWGEYKPEQNGMRFGLFHYPLPALIYQNMHESIFHICISFNPPIYHIIFLSSCAPDWVDPAHVSYGFFLVVAGFLLPVLLIVLTSVSAIVAIKKAMIIFDQF